MVNGYLNCVERTLTVIKALAINITMCKLAFFYIKLDGPDSIAAAVVRVAHSQVYQSLACR